MHKKRLLKLADFLETVPTESFNLKNWQISPATKPEGSEPGACGFAGCAIGWAAHSKMFRGLKLLNDGSGEFIPVYGGEEHWAAVGSLFDISHGGRWSMNGEAEGLFMRASYPASRSPTPKQVAKRIRKFVETGNV